MKKIIIALAACVLMVGCSSEVDDPAKPEVYGDWIYVDVNDASGSAITLNKNGEYVASYIQIISQSEYGGKALAVVEGGSFQLRAKEIVFSPTASSCPNEPLKETVCGYTISANHLTLMCDQYIMSMKKNQPSNSDGYSMSIITGCFEADGKFYSHTIQKH